MLFNLKEKDGYLQEMGNSCFYIHHHSSHPQLEVLHLPASNSSSVLFFHKEQSLLILFSAIPRSSLRHPSSQALNTLFYLIVLNFHFFLQKNKFLPLQYQTTIKYIYILISLTNLIFEPNY